MFAKFNSFVHCRHEFTIIKSVSLSLLVFLFKAAVYVEPEGTAVWLRTGDTWLERMVVISGLLRWASH